MYNDKAIFENVDDLSNVVPDVITKLSKDLNDAAKLMSFHEARFLVDSYYQMQNDRIRAKNQVRAVSQTDEPSSVLLWVSDNTAVVEKQIGRALTTFAKEHFVGRWAMSVCGIGPIISAGLLAHIDIAKAPNVGHIMSFAGMLPKARPWLESAKARAKAKEVLGNAKELTPELVTRIVAEYGKSPEAMAQSLLGENPHHYNEAVSMLTGVPVNAELVKYLTARPHNASLKTLLWKIGESFVKVSGRENDFYGKFYARAKAVYIERNERGDYAEVAAQKLRDFNIGKGTDAYAAYSAGLLPPAHIQSRAKRKAVDLFISHWWEVAFRHRFPDRECVKPYSMGMDGNREYIPIHNNPFE